MPGIGGALDIARWSLYSSQLAIEVLSHNIANANTPGYSRQQLKIESNVPITMGPGQIGTGVKATEVTRYYDAFINEQVTLKKSQYYYWDAQNRAMEEIETIFNEATSTGSTRSWASFGMPGAISPTTPRVPPSARPCWRNRTTSSSS